MFVLRTTNTFIKPFQANLYFYIQFPFYIPFSGVFRGYKMGTLARNGLK